MNLLKRIFATRNEIDFKQLQRNGAVILDVRSADEFKSGHISGAINLPLQNLSHDPAKIKELKKPVITCCLSGGRSNIAAKMLMKAGVEAYNGGGWTSLRTKLR
ncbi:MAG: rhodanese-like domain-containing protein [Bacteroidota bacterium]